jgi:hypothetical protein
MARTFVGLAVLGCVVCATALLGAYLLERRWNHEGFYE